MASPKDIHPFNDNRLLASLPQDEYARLRPLLDPIRLPQGKVLYEAGDTVRHAYFLTSGMASLLATTADDTTVQVAMVGNEGLVGLPALVSPNFMPYRIVVQLPALALRLKASAFSVEFKRGGHLQEIILRYLLTLLTQITQSALCNRYHTIEERLCRWLLISRDRAQADQFALTQESLAYMLGAQRTGVTATASGLQRAGLISYRRGKIRLLDSKGLESASCECYRVISTQLAEFLAA
jgi:CRP-like cAMP-binding protein